jgi:hypothetical protein
LETSEERSAHGIKSQKMTTIWTTTEVKTWKFKLFIEPYPWLYTSMSKKWMGNGSS